MPAPAKKAAPQGIKIIGSLASPFVRITRVVCEELKLPYELEITPPYKQWIADPVKDAFIREHNPLMKIPILIDGGEEILDSRVIAGHLLSRYGERAADFRKPSAEDIAEDNILTVIYGILDAGILSYILTSTHPEIRRDAGYMARLSQRIRAGLEWLDAQKTLGRNYGLTEVALISALEWFKKREVFDWSAFDQICKVYGAYCERPALVNTRIPQTT